VTTTTTAFATTDSDIGEAFPVMRQLRPHLDGTAFVATVRAAEPLGLQLVLHRVDGRVVAVAGIRLLDQLKSARVLYVDDLVTDETTRSAGHGEALLQWLVEHARANGCVAFELDSGVHRHAAHRFYFRQRMRIAAYHFTLDL